jgi:hypothetical protein
MRVRMESTGHSLKHNLDGLDYLIILEYIPSTPSRNEHAHLCHDLVGCTWLYIIAY